MTKLSNFFLGAVLKTPIEHTANIITRLDLEQFIRDSLVESESEEDIAIDTELFENALHLKKIKVEHEYLFSGRLEISYLNEKYENLDFPEGDYHTLSGYIVMTNETIPQKGEIITLDDYQFNLEVVSDTKIELIRVTKIKTGNEEAIS